MEGVPMVLAGVTRAQVFETAETRVREGQRPLLVS
jgi:hypothetical protein